MSVDMSGLFISETWLTLSLFEEAPWHNQVNIKNALGIIQMIYVSLQWVMSIAWIYFVCDLSLCVRKNTIIPASKTQQPTYEYESVQLETNNM